jgi:hypothetical protein
VHKTPVEFTPIIEELRETMQIKVNQKGKGLPEISWLLFLLLFVLFCSNILWLAWGISNG